MLLGQVVLAAMIIERQRLGRANLRYRHNAVHEAVVKSDREWDSVLKGEEVCCLGKEAGEGYMCHRIDI